MNELIQTYQAVLDATQLDYETFDDLDPFADKIKAFLLAKHTVLAWKKHFEKPVQSHNDLDATREKLVQSSLKSRNQNLVESKI